MSDRRTGGWTESERAIAVAKQLHHECSKLMELYRAKESFVADVADIRLLPPPSTHLDAKNKLSNLHFALLQCSSLLERAIAKEEGELGSGNEVEYEKLRKMVKERLSILLSHTELLIAADGGSILTPNVQLESLNTVFELKIKVYQVYKEVDYWTKTAISTLQSLPTIITKDRARTTATSNIASTYLR